MGTTFFLISALFLDQWIVSAVVMCLRVSRAVLAVNSTTLFRYRFENLLCILHRRALTFFLIDSRSSACWRPDRQEFSFLLRSFWQGIILYHLVVSRRAIARPVTLRHFFKCWRKIRLLRKASSRFLLDVSGCVAMQLLALHIHFTPDRVRNFFIRTSSK